MYKECIISISNLSIYIPFGSVIQGNIARCAMLMMSAPSELKGCCQSQIPMIEVSRHEYVS